ncbi:hypothetical protein HNQ94_001989 [Salirhabdus euzebyi]|uniref:Beta-lactamase-related domain-containing protein n=1 Tax=Salirhabdus euzebyi TaxID=394506 RepID=A0A841Q587_9BACI|nr:serine hydrolase [Salirhabdus euzebyi]MBB6453540.1 hypothetical protein [Salirhabdus euzebyi]
MLIEKSYNKLHPYCENQVWEEFNRNIKKDKISSCIIVKDGTTILEYFKNAKKAKKQQKINSCTKSFLSALIGIAIDKGYIESVEVLVSNYFPDLIHEQEDKRKRNLTLYHLLTMSDGLNFPEWGEWNAFAPMIYSSDIVKFVLDRPLEYSPGEKMNYNSGCSHVLTAILQKATSMTALEFAKKYLFGPMGIFDVHWHSDRQNINRGADGLTITVADLVKFGQLYLQEGKWNQKQLISKDWVRASTKGNLVTYPHIGSYGMHWWATKIQVLGDEEEMYFALGHGGQYIIVIPTLKIVTVMTSELYEHSLRPMQFFKQLFEKVT